VVQAKFGLPNPGRAQVRRAELGRAQVRPAELGGGRRQTARPS